LPQLLNRDRWRVRIHSADREGDRDGVARGGSGQDLNIDLVYADQTGARPEKRTLAGRLPMVTEGWAVVRASGSAGVGKPTSGVLSTGPRPVQ
jgi:hypothetical protein